MLNGYESVMQNAIVILLAHDNVNAMRRMKTENVPVHYSQLGQP